MLLKWLLGQEFPGDPVGAYTAGAPGSILDWGSSFESRPKKKTVFGERVLLRAGK